jgi:hypothetical protein
VRLCDIGPTPFGDGDVVTALGGQSVDRWVNQFENCFASIDRINQFIFRPDQTDMKNLSLVYQRLAPINYEIKIPHKDCIIYWRFFLDFECVYLGTGKGFVRKHKKSIRESITILQSTDLMCYQTELVSLP